MKVGDRRLMDLGKSLRLVRRKVYRETLIEFSNRLNISHLTLQRMEGGHPGVAIGTWMQAFLLMQVDTSVVDAARPDALIFAVQAGDISRRHAHQSRKRKKVAKKALKKRRAKHRKAGPQPLRRAA